MIPFNAVQAMPHKPRSQSDLPLSPELILLDRDGVINFDSDDYIKSAAEWRPLPGSLDAIVSLRAAGTLVAVATNQSGLARGYFTQADLDAMHAKLERLLFERARERGLPRDAGTLNRIVYCPHGPDAGCACRKPQPGMLLELLQFFAVAAERAIFMGDSMSDLEAARAAGIAFALARTCKGESTLAQLGGEAGARSAGIAIFADLADFVLFLLSAAANPDGEASRDASGEGRP